MESFIVSARKYRPESFSTVVGQDTITTTLKNAIKNHHLGHAYLFCGPRGVGKTTCARIFAKTINCKNLTAEHEACNECESCVSFNEIRAFNIHELDAASNNSVDDIRNLTDQVRIPPQVGKYSIYIIDEVHMLSASAFNSFLKTLEEPPAHAIFILATTEKHKIIPTILSRCQIFDFNRIKVNDIVGFLSEISKKESVEYEPDALNIIAQKADGAMRDALSIFDQIVSFAGNKILYTDVIKNLNILDYEYYFKLTQAFLDNNISEALLLFNEILDKGFDGHNFLNGMSGHLRDLLVCKDQVTLELLDVGATIREKYLSQSQACDQDFIYSALDICSSADISYKSSRNQRLHVELTLIRLCNISSVKKKTVADIEEPTDQKTEAKEDLKIQQEQNAEPGDESKTEPGLDKVTNSDRTDLPESEADIRAFQQKSISPKKTSTGLSIKDALNGNMNDNKHASDPTEEKQITEPPLNEPFTQEQLISHWQKFADDILSERPRMYNTLKSHLPQLASGFEISVLLDNTTQKDEFNKEIRQDLTRYLKISLNNTQLEIIPSVKVEDSDQVKLYTAEEKYEFMNKKNPNLGKMKQHFNLDFD